MASRNGGQGINKPAIEARIAELSSCLRTNVKSGMAKLAFRHAREIATLGFLILECKESGEMIAKAIELSKIASAPWTFTEQERNIFELAYRLGYAKRFDEERERS